MQQDSFETKSQLFENLNCYRLTNKQEISVNAHETRDNITLISYAGCLNVFPVISAKIHSLSICVAAKNREKFTKTHYF